jgi:hypothetical protein
VIAVTHNFDNGEGADLPLQPIAAVPDSINDPRKPSLLPNVTSMPHKAPVQAVETSPSTTTAPLILPIQGNVHIDTPPSTISKGSAHNSPPSLASLRPSYWPPACPAARFFHSLRMRPASFSRSSRLTPSSILSSQYSPAPI